MKQQRPSNPNRLTVNHRYFFIAIVVASLIGTGCQAWLLWGTDRPLGVLGEWVWARFSNSVAVLWSNPIQLLSVVGAGSLLAFWLVWTGTSEPKSPRPFLWLTGLMVCGLCWIYAVIDAVPVGGGLGRSVFVMYYPRTSGYFYQAVDEAQNPREFLRKYEASISDARNPDNYLHIGTHPPGLTMLHRLSIAACHASPRLTASLLAWQPQSVKEALEFLQTQNRLSGTRLTPPDAAALWLSILLSCLMAVATVVPIYLIAVEVTSVSSARLVSGLWVLVPALLVFLPKSDAFFPFLAVSLQWLWMKSLKQNSIWWGMLSAALFTFAASLSLAFMTVAVVFFLQWLTCLIREHRGWRPLVAGTVVGLVLIAGLYFSTGANLVTIWLKNFQNHGAFYDHNTRTFIDWLWVNPFEAAIAVGAPIAICGVTGSFLLLFQKREERLIVLPGLLVWALLYLSGKNMGEAARLWLFLMPYAVLAMIPVIERLLQSQTQLERRFAPATLIILQLLVCYLTATQIDGFGFTDF